MNSAAPKPIFLHLKAFPLSERQRKKIKEAGYVTVPVESFDSVKIIEPALLLRTDPIAKAAFATLASLGYDSAPAKFGRVVAKVLSETEGI